MYTYPLTRNKEVLLFALLHLCLQVNVMNKGYQQMVNCFCCDATQSGITAELGSSKDIRTWESGM
jgi:hypothetical protein